MNKSPYNLSSSSVVSAPLTLAFLAKMAMLFLLLVVVSMTGCTQQADHADAPSGNSASSDTIHTDESVATSQTADNAETTVAADNASEVQTAQDSERLGTKWGDEVTSIVTTVDLVRNSDEPIAQMQLHYANKNYEGRAVNTMSLLAGKIEFSITSDGAPLKLYRQDGHYYVQGRDGMPYQLVYQNNSSNIYEVVASVDGLDVIDGSAASRYHFGYVLKPHSRLVIEGFRKSNDAVASFIFSQPQSAYAANTDSGSISNTGIIGSVFYELSDPDQSSPAATDAPQAFPADDGYAKAPN